MNDFFGNGNGGDYFDDACVDGRKIVSVELYKSEYYGPTVIRAINVTYSDGANYVHGLLPDESDATADSISFQFEEGETLIGALGYSGRFIDSLGFITENESGESTLYGPFGGPGGDHGYYVSRKIVSLRGRAKEAIDAIGFNILV